MRDIPKCPNCGSTAQVRLVDKYELLNSTNTYFFQKEKYKCGCSCVFSLEMSGTVKVEVNDDKMLLL